jgi:hypothetical protein
LLARRTNYLLLLSRLTRTHAGKPRLLSVHGGQVRGYGECRLLGVRSGQVQR